jgi:hypothetical protein
MKLLIQLNFGLLGNFYIASTQLLEFANHYKKLGYECNLIFASNSGGRNGYGISDIQFEEIFDVNYFNLFDNITTIQHAITDKNYEEYICHSSDRPGLAWWDVFFNTEIKELYKTSFNHNDSRGFLRDEVLPEFLPKFNQVVYDKVKNFKEQNPQIDSTIQLRLYGYGDKENHNSKLTQMYSELYELIKNSNKIFYLTSSCISCLGGILELPNVYLFGSRNLQENKGDVNFDNIIGGREKQLDTFYDYIAEMVMISETDSVYYYSIHWQSTFLYYSFANNPNINITHINNLK